MDTIRGHAPCKQCGTLTENLLLDLNSVELDKVHGGCWLKVVPEVDKEAEIFCMSCGEPFIWFHVSESLPLCTELKARLEHVD